MRWRKCDQNSTVHVRVWLYIIPWRVDMQLTSATISGMSHTRRRPGLLLSVTKSCYTILYAEELITPRNIRNLRQQILRWHPPVHEFKLQALKSKSKVALERVPVQTRKGCASTAVELVCRTLRRATCDKPMFATARSLWDAEEWRRCRTNVSTQYSEIPKRRERGRSQGPAHRGSRGRLASLFLVYLSHSFAKLSYILEMFPYKLR